MVTEFEYINQKLQEALLREIRNLTAEVKTLRLEIHDLKVEQEISNGLKRNFA